MDDDIRWQRAQISGALVPVSSLPHPSAADEGQQDDGTRPEGGTTSLTAAVVTAAQRRAELQAELQQSIHEAMQVCVPAAPYLRCLVCWRMQ